MIALLLFLVLLQLGAPDDPAEADRLLALGNELFAEGDFAGAAAAYERAAATGWTSPALEANLGTAHAEAGRLGRAVLHLERALRLDPHDEAAAHNLTVVRGRLGHDAPASLPISEAAGRWLAAAVGSGLLAALAFALYLGVAALLGAWAWRRSLPAWRRRALVVLAPLTLLVGGGAVLAARAETMARAVVVAESAALRTAPTPEAASAGSAPEGAVLVVTDRAGGWAEVRLPDGGTGWAEAGAVEEL